MKLNLRLENIKKQWPPKWQRKLTQNGPGYDGNYWSVTTPYFFFEIGKNLRRPRKGNKSAVLYAHRFNRKDKNNIIS